jgi:hypothetical protein
MKTLKTQFRKNELDYTLLKRTDKIALFLLGSSSLPDGYEVCRIYFMSPHKAFGVEFEASEVISSNDQFLFDGSGSFSSLENVLRHYDRLLAKFVCKEDVEPEKVSDTELIVGCQAVGEDAL